MKGSIIITPNDIKKTSLSIKQFAETNDILISLKFSELSDDNKKKWADSEAERLVNVAARWWEKEIK